MTDKTRDDKDESAESSSLINKYFLNKKISRKNHEFSFTFCIQYIINEMLLSSKYRLYLIYSCIHLVNSFSHFL